MTQYDKYKAAYQEHAVNMAHALDEAGQHIAAIPALDEAPKQLRSHITDIRVMLSEAYYHADRMVVFEKLMRPKADSGTPITESEARALDGNR